MRLLNDGFLVDAELAVTGLSYAPNGAHLAVGLVSGEVQVFDIESNSCVFTLQPHHEVSSGTTATTVDIILHSFPQYPAAASALAYSEDGQLLAVGHRNGQIQIWRGLYKQRILKFIQKTIILLFSAAYTGPKDLLASGSELT